MNIHKEQWKNIAGWESYYQISDLGRLKSLKRSFVVKDRILKSCTDLHGYLFAGLFKNGKRLACPKIHRLVLETFVGPRPIGMECRHIDGNKLNNNLLNLEWTTHRINELDKYKHGTIMCGSKNGYAKLTEINVFNIRRLWETGKFTQWELANKFNVYQSCIWSIIHKKSWKHVN